MKRQRRQEKRPALQRVFALLMALCLFVSGCQSSAAFKPENEPGGVESSETSETSASEQEPRDEEAAGEGSEELSRLLGKKNQEYDPLSCILTAEEGFTAAEKRNYTVMIYMIGSNLESAGGNATLDLAEMQEAGLDYSRTNLLVYTGGSMRWNSDVPCDRNCVLDLSRDSADRIVASTEKNADMGAPDALAEFVNFAAENYPADHYALFFWDHGGGPLWGYGSDELFGGDGLLLYELNEALQKTPFVKGEKLDLIGFDACLMGNLETMFAVQGTAEYFIGSEDLEPGAGWDYHFLSLLNETDDPVEIGKGILSGFEQYYTSKKTENFNPDLTLVMTDLKQISKVSVALNSLAEVLSSTLSSEDGFHRLAASRVDARSFGALDNGEESAFYYDLVDVRSLAMSLAEGGGGTVTGSDVTEKVNALTAALDSFIVDFYSNLEDAYGISVYFPSMNRSQFYEMKDTYQRYGVGEKYMALLSEIVKWQQSGMREDWTIPSPVLSGDEYVVHLSEEQAGKLTRAYLTVLIPVDEFGSEFTSILDRYPLTVDENGVIHLAADPSLIAMRSGAEEYIWPVRVVEESANRFIYQTKNTRVRSGSLLHYEEEEYESISITLKQMKADGSLSIQSVNSVSDDFSFGGKDTIDVSHYKTIYYHYSGMIPSFREDGTPLRFADWEKGGLVGSMNMYLEEDFGFTLKSASEEFESIYYVVTIEDESGEDYNSEITQIPLSQNAEVYKEKTAQGEMTFYVYEDHAELTGYSGTDSEIAVPGTVLDQPVTIIGNGVFGKAIYYSSNGYYPVEKVTLPESIVQIEEGAFRNCLKLQEINLPEGITSIGHLAFADCRSLQAIELPKSLQKIGMGAFAYCASLETVVIPASVTEIGDAAFAACTKLTEIRMDGQGENSRIAVQDSLVYDKERQCVLAYAGAKEGTVTLPEGTVSVAERAFERCALEGVVLPDSLKVIGSYGFYGCQSLTFPNLPDSLEEIGMFAFDVELSAIPQKAIPGECSIIQIGPHVRYIGFNAFGGVANKAFEVSEENEAFSASEGCLMNKAGDVLIEFATDETSMLRVPEGCVSMSLRSVEFINNYDSDHCPVMLYIPEHVLYIGVNERSISTYHLVFCTAKEGVKAYAEQNGYRLISMDEPLEGETTIDTENGTMTFWLFETYAALIAYEGTDETLQVPAEAEGLPVTTIGDSENALFAYGSLAYDALEKVHLPDSIRVIQDKALDGTQVRVINLPEGLTYIGDRALNCRVTIQMLPDSIEYLGEEWLSDWSHSFTKGRGLQIPSHLGEVSGLAFRSSRPFLVGEDHPLYTVIDGMLCSKDGTTLVAGYCAEYEGSVTVPSGIETVGEGAFYRASLGELFLPESVASIETKAFANCYQLRNIHFNEGLENIGENAFTYCKAKNLVFPSTLKTIGYAAFSSSEVIWAEFTGETVSIGGNAFKFCDDLEFLLLHEGLKEIGVQAFDGTALRKLKLPESLQKVEDYAFGFEYKPENVNGEPFVLQLGQNLKEVSAVSFSGLNLSGFEVSPLNPYLSSVGGLLMDRSGKALIACPSAFEGDVTVPEGTYKFGNDAFSYSLYVTSILIPDSVQVIDRAFGRNGFDKTVILVKCHEGSAAQRWAIECGWPYEIIP